MSLDAYRWAWSWQNHPEVSTAAGKVLLALADHHNTERGDNSCWPSLVRLADMTGTSPSAVIRYLHQLETVGAITRQSSKGGRPRTGERRKGTPPATSSVCTLHLDRGPNGESYPHPNAKQSQGETLSDAKQSQGETPRGLRVIPEPEREPEETTPTRVSPERNRPRPTEGTGEGISKPQYPHFPNGDLVPQRLRPVIEQVADQLVTHTQQTGYRIDSLTGFTKGKRTQVAALVYQLNTGPTVWPAWLTHGAPNHLVQALVSKFLEEPVSTPIADQLDEAVRHAQQEPPALNNTA